MMPQLSASLSLSVSEVGYLVSFYAGAMALAGPVLTLCLSGRPPKQALLILYSLFLLAQGVAIMAQDYWLLVVTRIIIGAAAGAFFGITVGRVGELVPEAQKCAPSQCSWPGSCSALYWACLWPASVPSILVGALGSFWSGSAA